MHAWVSALHPESGGGYQLQGAPRETRAMCEGQGSEGWTQGVQQGLACLGWRAGGGKRIREGATEAWGRVR